MSLVNTPLEYKLIIWLSILEISYWNLETTFDTNLEFLSLGI
ncbi:MULTISPECIES: hypothetical protein [unclassified Mycoplasma]